MQRSAFWFGYDYSSWGSGDGRLTRYPPSSSPRGVMRTLVVAYEYPWWTESGSRLRLLTTKRALCCFGPTQFWAGFRRPASELVGLRVPDHRSLHGPLCLHD